MTELEKLAARVEREGPSRELFERAYEAVFGYKPNPNRDCNKRADTFCALLDIGAPEALLGAAMMLVPEGCGIDLMRYWIGAVEHAVWRAVVTGGGVPAFPRFTGECSDVESPAAALCAAALRARQESRND